LYWSDCWCMHSGVIPQRWNCSIGRGIHF